ncbi:hypothetical protein [Papillibacter cinnamivorans]|uniref:hypothetical protein n=1 Tax=Papillibacter cinnamivorans TaxID=100176 RepID=UPI00117F405C|nr:hypothetical protein [Papillibacter cinnamivorans]
MRGKRIFTEKEAAEIRVLIKQKQHEPDKQKAIRDKIRRRGFYYNDFRPNRNDGGYTVEDFNELIDTGEIQIVD